jgi:hypothetical protein
MKVYYSEAHRKHDPPFEVFDGGLRVPYLENPDRIDRILNELAQSQTDWAEIRAPRDFGLDPIGGMTKTISTSLLLPGPNGWLPMPKTNPHCYLLPSRFGVIPKSQPPSWAARAII